ncbi:unnamed protein product [Didymodactylos carnosus]|uniref:CSD domain-containing protein n=1 Tax=Didymodactylos carnosus TaxID=1234261 RepID=A0A8S2D8M8_9BILA|nr:unnamed protein product [Didymodactylos carnosus]CAF3686267.1 unnamed protein product [Didymodactylos carnosus]
MWSRSTNETPDRRNLRNCKLSSDHPVEDEEDDKNTGESEESDGDSDEQSSNDDDVSITNSENDVESMDEEPVDDAESLSYQQDEAMKKLSHVFKLLNLGPIHDRSAVCPIRLKIDEIYRELHQLCDVLEGGNECSRGPNPHGLLVSESNELLDGLKMLFSNGSDQDQVRLMTIAPKIWGRQKTEKCMATIEFKGLSLPVMDDDDNWTRRFRSSDRTKPDIVIDTIHIHPSSHTFDSKKGYVGLIVYLCDDKNNFTLRGVHCRTEKKLGFVGAGFSYRHGEWKWNSGTLNTINPNNNDDTYHNTNRALNEYEEQLLQKVINNLYENHRWRKMESNDRVSIEALNAMKSATNSSKNDKNTVDPKHVKGERKLHGKVIWFNYKHRYGFIECLGFDEDIFVHSSAMQNWRSLYRGVKVQFNVVNGRQGHQAANVTIIE